MGLFNRKRKKEESTERERIPSHRPIADSHAQTPEARLREAVMQTLSPPLGNQEEAWKWVTGEIRALKAAGIAPEHLQILERNVLFNLTEVYCQRFNEFKELAGDATSIIMTCEELLAKDLAEKAKAVADPYLEWLLANPAEWDCGQLCFQGPIEIAMYAFEHPYVTSGEAADDNYTHFLVLYCRILDAILPDTVNAIDEKEAVKRQVLDIALKISPCNSTVWNAVAMINSDNPTAFRECCDKALRYCVRSGMPYGLGQVYSDMALHYAVTQPELGWALSEVAEVYDGEPLGAMLVLSKRGYSPAPGANAISILEQEGIQIGYSALFHEANSYVERTGR